MTNEGFMLADLTIKLQKIFLATLNGVLEGHDRRRYNKALSKSRRAVFNTVAVFLRNLQTYVTAFRRFRRKQFASSVRGTRGEEGAMGTGIGDLPNGFPAPARECTCSADDLRIWPLDSGNIFV